MIMSYTELYEIKDNKVFLIGEVKNAFKGAMYVWNQISKKYFGLDNFPLFDEDLRMKIWNAQKHNNLEPHEEIVLISTMDNVTVNKKDLEKLIEAFEKYGEEHKNSSFSEQARIIKCYLEKFGDDSLLAWNQTSVNQFCFEGEYNEDEDYYEAYKLSDSFDLFEHFFNLNKK